MRKLLVVCTFISLLASCKKKSVPDGIIEPEKMQAVFWDYIRADVYSRDFVKKEPRNNDTLENIKLQKRIFNYYHISREEFERSYDYYLNHPDLMNVLMDSINAKQNRRQGLPATNHSSQ